MYIAVDQIDYNQLRANGAKKKGSIADIEGSRPMANQLKTDLIKNRKAGQDNPLNDEFEGMTAEERDAKVLGEI